MLPAKAIADLIPNQRWIRLEFKTNSLPMIAQTQPR